MAESLEAQEHKKAQLAKEYNKVKKKNLAGIAADQAVLMIQQDELLQKTLEVNKDTSKSADERLAEVVRQIEAYKHYKNYQRENPDVEVEDSTRTTKPETKTVSKEAALGSLRESEHQKTDTKPFSSNIEKEDNRDDNNGNNDDSDDADDPGEPVHNYSSDTESEPELDYHMHRNGRSKPKLDANTPTFTGKKTENLREWLFVIEQNMKLSRIHNSDKLAVITNFVKDVPLQLLIKHINTVDCSWHKYKKILMKHFQPLDYDRRLRQQLRELKQTDSVDNYTRRFLAIINQIPDMSQKDIMFNYMEGLQPTTKYQVLSKTPKKLEDAIATATQFESCCNNSTVGEVNSLRKLPHMKSNRPPQRKQVHAETYTRSKPASTNRDAKGRQYENTERRKMDYSKVSCHKCHKVGHIARFCRSALPQNNRDYSRRRNNKGVKQANVAEAQQVLSINDSSTNDNLLQVEGTLNGLPISYALDSGSTIQILSRRFVTRHNIEIFPTTVRVKTANNAIVEADGVTRDLMIDIHGHCCPMSFVVMDHDGHDALLGLGWFNETGAGLFPKQNILRFPGDSIQLNNNKSEDDAQDTEDVLHADIADEADIQGNIDWAVTSEVTMEPATKLTSEQKIDFEILKVEAIRNMFARNFAELGCCTITSHEVKTNTDVPVFVHPYRRSEKERKQLQEEITLLLIAGIIRLSRSPYASPVFLIPKKDGTWRMAVDYRLLNKITETEQWPLPRINDILDGLSGSTWFTALDLKSGYYQIRLSNRSMAKTAFSTPDGHYEFTRIPFGLKNAPAHFSKIMFQVLGDLSFVKIYLDDITIHSKSFEDHIQHVRIVLQRLKEANLKLNGDKCAWFALFKRFYCVH